MKLFLLTVRYFLEQKVAEIWEGIIQFFTIFLIVCAVVGVFALVAFSIGSIVPESACPTNTESHIKDVFGCGVIYIYASVAAAIIGALLILFVIWIRSNWRMAKKRSGWGTK